MVGLLVLAGALLVFIGSIACTDRIEGYWKARRLRRKPVQRDVFYRTGCQACGMDDTPLNQNRHCYYCADLHQITTGGRPIPTLPIPSRMEIR